MYKMIRIRYKRGNEKTIAYGCRSGSDIHQIDIQIGRPRDVFVLLCGISEHRFVGREVVLLSTT